jgi:hypothetical protein
MTEDKVVLQVIDKLSSRSARGMSKYGTSLERDDLTLEEWLIHLQEELLDGANYVQVLLNKVQELEKIIEKIKIESNGSILPASGATE